MTRTSNANSQPNNRTLLQVNELSVGFQTRHGVLKAVDGIDFAVDEGQTLGIVGESGCGKSVTALSMLRLLPDRLTRISGSVLFAGRDILALSRRERQSVRGREIGFVFQDPMSSLNPSMTVGRHLVQTMRRHLPMSQQDARRRALELLDEVQIPQAATRLDDHPHHFSGGMRQRVGIALAICCNPRLLIADEPTTALDVTVQAQILSLLADLRDAHGMAMILISHDMGVIAESADDVAVMYAGQIVEYAHVGEILGAPAHPYTEALLGALPPLVGDVRRKRLMTIPGQPPNMLNLPDGCRFAPRCPYNDQADTCKDRPQPLRSINQNHWVRTEHPVFQSR